MSSNSLPVFSRFNSDNITLADYIASNKMTICLTDFISIVFDQDLIDIVFIEGKISSSKFYELFYQMLKNNSFRICFNKFNIKSVENLMNI